MYCTMGHRKAAEDSASIASGSSLSVRLDGMVCVVPCTEPPHLEVWPDARDPDIERKSRPESEGMPTSAVSRAVSVPLVGRIRAGDPISADEAHEETFLLPRQLVGEGTLFLLKVAGDSMIEAAIADGDWVIVRQQPVAENGQIVAALIDGEATVKTFRRSDGQVWLMPHNPAYEPIPGNRATLLGKVVVVLRRL
jgi:repressor LexA